MPPSAVVRHCSLAVLLLGATSTAGQVVSQLARASVNSAGEQAFGDSRAPRISLGGRCVTFASFANNLDPIGSAGRFQAFVRDLDLGITDLVSEAPGALAGNGDSGVTPPAASSDCRYVAFDSTAANLVANPTGGRRNVFLRDRQLGTTTLLSPGLAGAAPDGDSMSPTISGDGAYVAFVSGAANLVGGDGNNGQDIFVWSRATGTLTRLLVESQHDAHHRTTDDPQLSLDGERLVFLSIAPSFDVPEENGFYQIRYAERASPISTGRALSVDGLGNAGDRSSEHPRISADGLWATFDSQALNLPPACAPQGLLCTGVYRVALPSGHPSPVTPTGADGPSAAGGVSVYGDLVAFASDATNLALPDGNDHTDVLLGGPSIPGTFRISESISGGAADGESRDVTLAEGGTRIAFLSYGTDLVAGDTNLAPDVFVTYVQVVVFGDGFESGGFGDWDSNQQ
jgi:Tol biopolymer transport system component